MLVQLRLCGISQVSLHTASTNHVALRLYGSFGFEMVCRLENYYVLEGKECDAYWIRKDLNKPDKRIDLLSAARLARTGPWPLGLNFELLVLVIVAIVVFISILVWSYIATQHLARET